MTSSEIIAILGGLFIGYFVVRSFIGKISEKHTLDSDDLQNKDESNQGK